MILQVILAGVLAAGAPEVKLASPGLTGINLKTDVVLFYSDHLAQQMTLQGLRVITASEISVLMGLERQKQLLGCGESTSSCLAELANALGVAGVVTGSIGFVDGVYQVNVKVVAANDGRLLSAYSNRVAREREVLNALTEAASAMAPELRSALGANAPPEPTGRRIFALIPAAVGLAGVGVGVAMFASAGGDASRLRGTAGVPSVLSPAEAADVHAGGKTKETVGVVAVSVGVAALVGAGVLFLFSGSPTVTAAITPQGAFVGIAGELP
jgi:TolB-like protein